MMFLFSDSDSDDNLLGQADNPTSPGNQSTSVNLDPGAAQSSTAGKELATKAEGRQGNSVTVGDPARGHHPSPPPH